MISLIYFQVWLGVLGSLYFSNVMKLPPCALCVYQRMLLYPLALIIGVALWRGDKKNLPFYVLPFSVLGIIVSLYHNLIYWKIIPFELIPCSVQLPCTVQDFVLFGFVTIPLMSLVAFTLITIGISLFAYWQRNPKAVLDGTNC